MRTHLYTYIGPVSGLKEDIAYRIAHDTVHSDEVDED